MAKGDVTLKFNADTAKSVQDILKLREALIASADSTRKFGEEAGKADKHVESLGHHIEEISSGAGRTLAAAFGIGFGAAELGAKAAELAIEGVSKKLEEMEHRAGIFVNSTKTLNEALSASGQLESAPATRTKLALMADKDISGKKHSVTELTKAFVEVSGQLGSKATPEQKLAGVEAAMVARSAEMGEGESVGVGVNYARMLKERRKGGAYDGYSDEQLREEAYRAQVLAPNMSDRELKFISESRDPRVARNMVYASRQSAESARALVSLQNASEEDIDPKTVALLKRKEKRDKRHFTSEDRRHLLLSAIPKGEDRLQAMLADESLAPEEQRVALRALMRGARNIPSVSLKKSLKSEPDAATETAVTKESIDRFNESTEAGTGPEDALANNVRNARIAIFRRQHPVQSLVTPDWAKADAPYEERREEKRFRRANGRDMNDQESLAFLLKIIQAIDNQTKAIQQQHQEAMGRHHNSDLSNPHQEGQH